jgi:hypothetical protein
MGVKAMMLAVALALAACAAVVEEGPVADAEREPPVGAIKIDEDLYQVPVGPDQGGCMQYTLWSRERAVVAVIWYRDREGGFTTDRAKADCP